MEYSVQYVQNRGCVNMCVKERCFCQGSPYSPSLLQRDAAEVSSQGCHTHHQVSTSICTISYLHHVKQRQMADPAG